VMWLDGEPERLVVDAALDVGDGDLGEVVDPEGRRKVSGVGQDDAEGGTDCAHLHPDEDALATLSLIVNCLDYSFLPLVVFT
jgi:hypothetical protein